MNRKIAVTKDSVDALTKKRKEKKKNPKTITRLSSELLKI